MRALVEDRDKAAGRAVRILYGGSLKPDNAAELLALPDVDGALVGGASLDAASFAADRRGRPVVNVALIILDGWGLAADGPGNAISLAETPVFDKLWDEHAHTQLTAKGEAVGLPEGQMGNSEVGHLNLGAGAIVPQDLARINRAVEDGSLAGIAALKEALDAERVHLIGLVSGGGVHSSIDHLRALAELADGDVIVHAFTDGRDTSPTSGAGSLAEVESWGTVRVGSVVGRYFAMDRDKRWDRTEKAVSCCSRARRSTMRTAGSRPSAPPTSAARPTSSSRRPRWATRRGSGPATRWSPSTSGPTACGRSPRS